MRRFLPLLPLLIAGATAAAAQDADTLRACLKDNPDRLAAEAACMGMVFNACSEASKDYSTAGMVTCSEREIDAWDVLLNEYWPDVRARAKALDAQDAGADGAYSRSLLDAQRAWLAYREAECAWDYQRFAGGTIRSVMGAGCMMGMTARRVLDFQEWLQDG